MKNQILKLILHLESFSRDFILHKQNNNHSNHDSPQTHDGT